jgi:peptide/nickel transport system ATP-binding protein
MSALLQIDNLTVSYDTDRGELQALDGVGLTIGRGEVMGLVGESGCGKSTLAKTLIGILPRPAARIKAGHIHFDGDDLLELPEAEFTAEIRGRRITLVPQDPFRSLDALFRVGTQLSDLMQWKSPLRNQPGPGRFPLLARYPSDRRKQDRTRVLQMLGEVQIPDPTGALRKLPGELSGGQCQRLLIAMALLPQPELIVADEPTTALDVTTQAQILKVLNRLVRERGVSVLFTTHDLGVASELCDRIMVMYAGQEVETAPTEAFFHSPRHPYSAKLLQSVPRAGGLPQDIPGEVPQLVNPPAGCRFRTRCERASDACRQVRPPPVQVGDAHVVRCFHPLPEAA